MDDDAQPELTRSEEPASADPASGPEPARKGSAPKNPARKTPAAKAPVVKAPAKKAPARRSAARKGAKPEPQSSQPPSSQPPSSPPSKPRAQKSPAQKVTDPTVTDPTPTTPAGLTKLPAARAAKKAPAPPVEPEVVATPEPVVVPEPVAAPVAAHVAAQEPVTVPGPAAAEDVERAWKDNSLAQVLYHDWEAGTYDEKWSISFDDRCITYARDRFSAAVGPEVLRAEPWPYPKALEIGAGTGFFSLNLKQAGVVGEVHVTDVSAGMVQAAGRNAAGLGFEVTGAVAGAEELPYPDGTFDLVVGHAVIHHIPDVEAALREVLRVLRPGGRFVIAGEPTRIGDWYARRLGRLTWRLTTTVTRLPRFRETWARSDEELDASSRAAALEAVVDLHTFVPEELAATARRAGARQVRTQTEELLAAFLGWPVRTFEAAVKPEALGLGWAMFAYRSWRRLSAIDRLLHRFVPARFFYNVGITGIKGPGPQEP